VARLSNNEYLIKELNKVIELVDDGGSKIEEGTFLLAESINKRKNAVKKSNELEGIGQFNNLEELNERLSIAYQNIYTYKNEIQDIVEMMEKEESKK
jgi:DNA repair ATPase RecN